jgi:hypothetical protein
MSIEVIQTGLAMIDKYFCRVCKKELLKSDVLTICDMCLLSLDKRESHG